MAIVAVPPIWKVPSPAVFLLCAMFILRVLYQSSVQWYRFSFSGTFLWSMFNYARPKIETYPLCSIFLIVYSLCILGSVDEFPKLPMFWNNIPINPYYPPLYFCPQSPRLFQLGFVCFWDKSIGKDGLGYDTGDIFIFDISSLSQQSD